MFLLSSVSIGVALLFYASGAAAHPALLSSSPGADQTVTSSPRQVQLRFTEAIEADFTTVKVIDSAGKEVAAEPARREAEDPKSIVVPVSSLPPGAYRAQWSAAGKDGHRVKGEFRFQVK